MHIFEGTGDEWMLVTAHASLILLNGNPGALPNVDGNSVRRKRTAYKHHVIIQVTRFMIQRRLNLRVLNTR